MVQWLGLHASTAGGGMGSSPGQGTKIQKAVHDQKGKKKKICPWLLNRYEAPIPSSPKPIASQVDLCDHFTLGSFYQMISIFFFNEEEEKLRTFKRASVENGWVDCLSTKGDQLTFEPPVPLSREITIICSW